MMPARLAALSLLVWGLLACRGSAGLVASAPCGTSAPCPAEAAACLCDASGRVTIVDVDGAEGLQRFTFVYEGDGQQPIARRRRPGPDGPVQQVERFRYEGERLVRQISSSGASARASSETLWTYDAGGRVSTRGHSQRADGVFTSRWRCRREAAALVEVERTEARAPMRARLVRFGLRGASLEIRSEDRRRRGQPPRAARPAEIAEARAACATPSPYDLSH